MGLFFNVVIGAVAQTGPGGVDGATQNRFWYDANDLSATLGDGNSVASWASKGGNTSAATQSGTAQPTFRTISPYSMNGFPAIHFDGVDDYLVIPNNSDLNTASTATNRTYTMVFRTGADVNTRQVLYEEGASARGLNMYIYNGNVYVGAWNLPNDGSGSPWGFSSINTSIATSTVYILTFAFDGNSSTTGYLRAYLNGALFGTIGGVGILYSHGGGINIGGTTNTYFETGPAGSGYYFTGDISEFIEYNYTLGNAGRLIIENYLAAKYGLILSAGEYYAMDDNANGDYDYETAGIGQYTDASNNTDGRGPGIVEINNASGLGNNEFLLWGHDNGALSETTTGTPASIDNRLQRLWRCSVTGAPGTVSLSFDVSSISVSGTSASDFFLLTDAVDANFSDAGITGADSYSAGIVQFSGIALTDGMRFTLGINNPISATGYDGPGGIGGTSEYRFWLDANDLSATLSDGSAVQSWTNKGGNSNDAGQSTATAQPVFKTTAGFNLNNYPVILFDGSNDYLTIPDNTDLNSASSLTARTYHFVFKTSTDVTTRQVIYEEGGTVRGLNFYIFNGNLYISGWNTPNDGAGSPWGFSFINTPVAASTAYILTVAFNGNSTATGTMDAYLNGSSMGSINNVGILYSHVGDVGIGAKNNDTYYESGTSSGNGEYFGGSMAEMTVYNYVLTNAERIEVENYLSSKYNIALSANDYHSMDTAPNGDYDHEVAGIGRYTDGTANTVAKGPSIVTLSSPTALNNGDFELWGHDNGALTETATGTPAAVDYRLTRIWRFSENADAGNTKLQFDVSGISVSGSAASDFFLLVDAVDANFSDASVTNADLYSGGVVTFNSVNLANGDRVTLGINAAMVSDGNSGPGGILDPASYRFWFDADDLSSSLTDGAAVSTWSNKGGNSNDAVQSAGTAQPAFRNTSPYAMNSYPAIHFDGTTDYLSIANNTDLNSATSTERTFSMAIRTPADIATRQVLYEEGGTARGLNIYIFNSQLYVAGWNANSDGTGAPWSFTSASTAINSNTLYVLTMVYKGNSSISGTIKGYLNGTLFGTAANVGYLYPHTANIGIGAKYGDTYFETGSSTGNGQYYKGEIAEFVIYNKALSEAERIILENALSAKYGTTLSANDVYTMDNTVNGDYDHEVAGIGQATDGSYHKDSQGSGMVRMFNPSALSNGDYLCWGRDNGTACASTNVPASLNYRMSKVWRVSETADLGTVTLNIDMNGVSYGSAANLRLLRDADGDFSNATVVNWTGNTGDVFTLSGINFTDGEYFTVASTDYIDDGSSPTRNWNGTVSTDWFNDANWDSKAPTATDNAVIPASAANFPAINGNTATCNTLDLQAGASLTFGGTDTLKLYKNWKGNGTFNAGNGIVVVQGTCGSQKIISNGTQRFHHLTIDNSRGVAIRNNTVEVQGILKLVNGTLNTHDSLTLYSDATETGRLDAIPVTADITGQLVAERYIGVPDTFRTLFSTPVSANISQWDDDMYLSGVGGVDGNACCPVFKSIHWYDETATGNLNNGWSDLFTNVGDPIASGRGYNVFTSMYPSGNLKVDYRGTPNKGNISLPVTYTASAGSSDDGWNIVGNPYPCPINWDDPDWIKVNVNNAIYYWDDDIDNFAVWVSGIGVNGGHPYIQSAQGFWVQTNAASPQLAVSELVKTTVDSTFFRMAAQQGVLRLRLTGSASSDETILRLTSGATDGFDPAYDAWKFYSGTPGVPKLGLLDANGKAMAVMARDYPVQAMDIPLNAEATQAGLHQLAFSGMETMPPLCIVLEDLFTGQHYAITQDTSLSFALQTTGLQPRFILHLYPAPEVWTTPVSCYGSTDGSATLSTSGSSDWNYIWLQGSDTLMVSDAINGYLTNLAAGTYNLAVSDAGGMCPGLSTGFVISSPAPIVAVANITDPGIVSDGSIDLNISGGTAPYTVLWSNGASGTALNNIGAGTYTATITDAFDCDTVYTFTLTTGMTSLAPMDGLSVYPNPAKDAVFIETDGSAGVMTLRLYNTTGAVLRIWHITNNSKTRLDISGLAAGAYRLRIEDDTHSAVRLLMVR